MKSIACELPGNRQRPPAILLKLVLRGARYHRQRWCCGEAWATARRGVLQKNATRQRTQLDERRISGAARPRVSRRPRPPLCQADFVVRIAMRRFLMVELGWRMLCKSTSVGQSARRRTFPPGRRLCLAGCVRARGHMPSGTRQVICHDECAPRGRSRRAAAGGDTRACSAGRPSSS